MGFGDAGDRVLLLGETRDELGGSEWAHEVHGHLGGRPPVVDLGAERSLAEVLVAGAGAGLLAAAHDVSDGGLAQALMEMALRGDTGARVSLPEDLDPFVALFAESAGRAVVVVRPADEAPARRALCSARRPGDAARRGRWRGPRGRWPVRGARGRAPRRLDRDPPRAVRADRRLTPCRRPARSVWPRRSRPWTPSGRWTRLDRRAAAGDVRRPERPDRLDSR